MRGKSSSCLILTDTCVRLTWRKVGAGIKLTSFARNSPGTGLVQGDYSAEIRASFRGMTEKQRSDTILTAMSEGNSEVIAAVSLSPAILSGLDPNVQERSVEAIRQMKCPELIEESDDLSEALQTASAAKELAGIMFSENYDHAEQTAIDQAELDAASAESELTESIRESVCG
jgi:hypothetical protein